MQLTPTFQDLDLIHHQLPFLQRMWTILTFLAYSCEDTRMRHSVNEGAFPSEIEETNQQVPWHHWRDESESQNTGSAANDIPVTKCTGRKFATWGL